MDTPTMTSIVVQEGHWFIATCPQLDVVSQGLTEAEARENLKEAVGLLLECADDSKYRVG
jgi:predicted RNase H-like HicB family nuclease